MGSALAFAARKEFSALKLAAMLAAAALTMGWLNLSNDVFDAETGVDAEKVESVVARTGDPAAVLWLANLFLALGAGIFAALVLWTGDLRVLALLGGAVAVGYMYQGPPFRFSYRGWGEPMTVVAFAASTGAFYLIQAAASTLAPARFTPTAVAACLLTGFNTALILLASHFHQEATDREHGKRSPVVRLGTEAASLLLRALLCCVYVAQLALITAGVLPPETAATALSLGKANAVYRQVTAFHHIPLRVKTLKFAVAKWHQAFGVCLAVGLASSALFG